MNEQTGILVVDDEKNLREFLSIILTKEGYEVTTSGSASEALSLLEKESFDLMIQDIKMPGMDGIDLLRESKRLRPDMPVVIMTAYATWDTAVEAMRLGAFDFIRKPFENAVIRDTTRRLLEFMARRKAAGPDADDDITFHLAQIVGNSPVMSSVFSEIQIAAGTEATVLITGESGVGKDLVARALHYGSPRRDENFISINCSALVKTLLESEIFGHTKGAFTGAEQEKKGLLEIADKSTFFLDEIGDLDFDLQGKLLKVLEDREYYPVGATEKKRVDVRFIAATNQDLDSLIDAGRFREDLFYRINVIPVYIPPLRERKDDIPLLAGYFLNKYSRRYNKEIRFISEEVLAVFARHGWPGNVRELENCMQRAILTAQTDTVLPQDISHLISRGQKPSEINTVSELVPGFDLENEIQEIEKMYIEKALKESGCNLTAAAGKLGISFRSIRYKVKKYNISTEL
jgi:two-component system response regulator PilR (NtrC family)